MKIKFIILLFFLSSFHFSLKAQCYKEFKNRVPEWKQAKYKAADTGKNATYLNKEEKLFYYYLNLMRMNPSLFAETFLEKCKLSFVDKEKVKKFIFMLNQGSVLTPVSPYELGYEYMNADKEHKEKYIVTTANQNNENQFVEASSEQIAMTKLVELMLDNATRKYLLAEEVRFYISFLGESPTWKIYYVCFPRKIVVLDIKNLDKEPLQQYINHKTSFQKLVSEWKSKKYEAANTAKDETYLTKNEKLVYYYINLARMNPSLFAVTFFKEYLAWDTETHFGRKSLKNKPLLMDNKYAKGIYDKMLQMKPLPLLYPSQKLHLDATTHSGKADYEARKKISEEGKDTSNIISTMTFYYDNNDDVAMNKNFGRTTRCTNYNDLDALKIVMSFLASNHKATLANAKVLLDDQDTI